jgi:DNA-directed RNA polymerase specialized sigma subunit
MKIATHLAQKPNFSNYTFKEDMISDGIENCLQYIDNFDPEKSKNPFSYFTQIIWYAFIRRINKEKKLLYTKYKITEEVNLLHLASQSMHHDKDEKYGDNVDSYEWSHDYMAKFIDEFEKNKKAKAQKKSK